MDFSGRGGKTGTGGVASESEANRDRRERLRQLALETIDLAKDPYFMKNHLGTYECKLCLTLHNNEGSYLAHTQGKKHQYNLQRRAHEQSKEGPGTMQPEKARIEPKKFIKIGRPGYKVTKQKCPDTGQQSMLFQIDFPEIADANGIVPRHRFMSAYEQRIEPPDRKWQYLLFAAEPYETIAFKIPSREIDKNPTKLWTFWNPISKQFFLQFAFKLDNQSSSIAMLRDLELQKARAQQAQMQLHLPPPPPPPPKAMAAPTAAATPSTIPPAETSSVGQETATPAPPAAMDTTPAVLPESAPPPPGLPSLPAGGAGGVVVIPPPPVLVPPGVNGAGPAPGGLTMPPPPPPPIY